MKIYQFHKSSMLATAIVLLVSSRAAKADLPTMYEAQSGCAKQDYLWNHKILRTQYSPTMPSLEFGGWSSLLNILATPSSLLTLHQTFDHVSDELPFGRRKFIHPFGSVAKVVYRSTGNHPFTGLLADTEVCGLARLSVAGPPSAIGFTPGMALKLFVDGQASKNIQVMHSLQGQGDDVNFFSNMFSNNLPPIRVSIFSPTSLALKALEGLFAAVKADPRYLPVDEFTTTDAKGAAVAAAKAPVVIWFVPTSPMKDLFAGDGGRSDFRNVLASIEEDAVLYKVYGTPAWGEQAILMGTLSTASSFVPSLYGDETLFFRHNR